MKDAKSILAIDLTTYGLAFVAFNRGAVFDWGHRFYRQTGTDVLVVVDDLLAETSANVVVIEEPDHPACERRQRVRADLRAIRAHLRGRRIRVEAVPRREVRDVWRERGSTTKESVAAAIGEAIPELAPYVPPKRKLGWNEDQRVNLFDAASLALHAFPQLETR